MTDLFCNQLVLQSGGQAFDRNEVQSVRAIDTLDEIADHYSALVFDQWDVLHNGVDAYPEAIEVVRSLAACGKRLSVLSNSGKRIKLNAHRMAQFGFLPDLFEIAMISGELR